MHKALALIAVLALSGCSGINPLGFLAGGGINVAANTQAGKTNTQALQATVTEQKLVRPQARSIEQSTGDVKVRSERVETVVVHEKDAPWLILLLVAVAIAGTIGWIHGWRTPGPEKGSKILDLRIPS
jgi:hypothetical protein